MNANGWDITGREMRDKEDQVRVTVLGQRPRGPARTKRTETSTQKRNLQEER